MKPRQSNDIPNASIKVVKLEQYLKSSVFKVRFLSPLVTVVKLEHLHKSSVVEEMRVSSPSRIVVTLGQFDKLSFIKE
jgi:hypothetical protein